MQIWKACFNKDGRPTETLFEYTPCEFHRQMVDMIERIVQESGLKIPHSFGRVRFGILPDGDYGIEECTPNVVKVTVYKQTIQQNKIEFLYHNTFDVPVPLARITQAEFDDESQQLLKDVPPEFQAALASKAYEDGHSAGLEEVISCLQDLSHWLKEPLAAYTKRIQK